MALSKITNLSITDDAVRTVGIQDVAVTGAKINDDAISGQGALGAAPADTDEFLVSDAGTLKRVDYSYIKGITQTSFLPTANPILLNGDMAVAQRATSATGKTVKGFYTCDRYELSLNTLGTYTIIQEALTSGNAYADGFSTAWRIDCTTADASPAAGDELIFQIPIEGQDLQVFKKGTANAEKWTLAFWVKCSKTGTGQVNLSTFSRMCAATYTISSADTWEHKVLNFAADTTGTIDNDNSEEMRIEWWLDSGSNYEGGTAPTAWEAEVNTDRNAAGTLNIGDNTANDWAITGIQLEVGEYTSSDLPPFRHESYGDNLARCQRYCYKQVSGSSLPVCSGQMWTTGIFVGNLDFPVTMRAAPTVAAVNGTNYWKILSGGSEDSCDAYSINRVGTTGSAIEIQTNLSLGTQGYGAHARTANASAEAIFEAEL